MDSYDEVAHLESILADKKKDLAACRAEVARLRDALCELLELTKDMRGYCHDWDWKHGECWDDDLAKAEQALKGGDA